MFGFLKAKSKAPHDQNIKRSDKHRRSRRDKKRRKEDDKKQNEDSSSTNLTNGDAESLGSYTGESNSTTISENLTSKSKSFSGQCITNSSSKASIPSIATECSGEKQNSESNKEGEGLSNGHHVQGIPNYTHEHTNGNYSKPPASPRTHIKITKPTSHDEDDTSVSSSIFNNSLCDVSSISNHNDGNSMLSTPSSSTSSLSSLSLHSHPHSGRKTPPTPRLGTTVKMGTSPTPTRKVHRTNIKTNPNSSPNITQKSHHIKQITPKVPSHVVQSNLQISDMSDKTSESENSNVCSLEPPHSGKVFNGVNKTRNSLSSVNSLESIPESHPEPSNAPKSRNNDILRAMDNVDVLNSLLRESSKALTIVPEESMDQYQAAYCDSTNELKENSPEALEKGSDKEVYGTSHCFVLGSQMVDETEKNFDEKEEEDVSEVREPEVTEHRLELIPRLNEFKANLTSTIEHIPKDSKMMSEKSNEQEANSTSENSSSFVEPTHAVFQIPLRSNSCSREPTESPKRLSIEPESEITSNEQNNDIIPADCTVKGHMELNFDRGRKREGRSSTSPRRRSLSSLRRQKLYEDIRKFTAETKNLNIKRNSFEEYPTEQSECRKRLSRSYPKTNTEYQNKQNNLKEVSMFLRKKEGEKQSPSHPSKNIEPSSSTTSRTSPQKIIPKKLERSITVAEIRVNVNKSQPDEQVNTADCNLPSNKSRVKSSDDTFQCKSHSLEEINENTNKKSYELTNAFDIDASEISTKPDSIPTEIHEKELASLEAKYTEQLAKLKSALNQKQLEIQKTKEETEKILQEREEKFKSEREELKCKIEQEVNRKEEEEKRIQEEQSKTDEEEKQKSDDYENELDESKRKYDKVQMELLLLKQQNDEFEDIVRDKHRRQMEMEIQVDQITKDVEKKQTTIDSLRIELTYSKNESESSKLQIKKLTAELEEVKQRVETLESEIDNSERELKRMEIMQEKLQVTEKKREELQKQLDDIEIERDDEIKIIQDALDEAAQEREELLDTFEKEVERINSLNAEREKEMLADFEKKLRELEKEHNKRLAEKDKVRENSLARTKREEEEMKIKLEKIKNNLNSEWEDKIGKERCRVMAELATLHNDEKSTALESLKIQKENEMKSMKQTLDSKANELSKEVSSLKDKLTSKDSFYRQELDDMRTRSDRDVWELRRKLQRLDETTYEKQQMMEDKHREELERLKEEYQDKIKGLESQLSSVDVKGITELRTRLEKSHREAMEHMNDQHKLSMERLREELDAEKFQAVEDARVIVTKHHEYVNTTLRDQLTEAITANTQYREEIDAIRFALSRREEVIKSLEDDISLLKASRGSLSSSPVPQQVVPPYPGEGVQRNSLERTESTSEDKGSGLLGKVFGGGWFSGNKKENTAPQSNTSGQNKKPR